MCNNYCSKTLSTNLTISSGLSLLIFKFIRFVPHKEEENKPPGLLKDDLQYGKVRTKVTHVRFFSERFCNGYTMTFVQLEIAPLRNHEMVKVIFCHLNSEVFVSVELQLNFDMFSRYRFTFIGYIEIMVRKEQAHVSSKPVEIFRPRGELGKVHSRTDIQEITKKSNKITVRLLFNSDTDSIARVTEENEEHKENQKLNFLS